VQSEYVLSRNKRTSGLWYTIELYIIMIGLAIYTRFGQLKENLLQTLFPKVVYFQKSSAHGFFFVATFVLFICLLNCAAETYINIGR
jgi:hypothetical protein